VVGSCQHGVAWGGLAGVDDDEAVGGAGVLEQACQRLGRDRVAIARLRGGDQPQPSRRLRERRVGRAALVDRDGELAQAERRGRAGQGGEPGRVVEPPP
jgi:hypothetical protein